MTTENKNTHLDLAAIRARLEKARGPQHWRSLEELAETEEFQAFLRSEFPREVSTADLADPVSRRTFLKIMAASLALAGFNACTRQPAEQIFPYNKAPEEIIPGKPLFFATAMPLGGSAIGLLVESHMGRPTKVEGNPQHPASLGATDVFAQASVLTLYDPDRSEVVTNLEDISTWDAFLTATNAELDKQRANGGAGLRVLTETVTSPTLANQVQALLAAFPAAKWHQYEPVGRDNAKAGARLAFGEYVDTLYRFDQADVILSLGADFLSCGPGNIRYAHDFAAKRRVQGGQTEMSRLYAVESTLSNTGAMADHRLPLRESEIEGFARAVAQGLGVLEDRNPPSAISNPQWLSAVVRDLQSHRGSSIVLAGDQQPPAVHALAHAMNHALDNVGKTVFYIDPVEANPVEQIESLRELVNDMESGAVQVLIIIGGNPVFTAPADFRFAERLSKVGFRVHLSLYDDETSALCHWHIPETHYLESWSDARAYDGTVSIIQPLIAPLYGGKSAHELGAALLGKAGSSSHDIVREYWQSQRGGETSKIEDRGSRIEAGGAVGAEDTQAGGSSAAMGGSAGAPATRGGGSPVQGQPSAGASDFERWWRIALHDGLIADTARPPKQVMPKIEAGALPAANPQSAIRHPQSLETVFRPDPTIWDGRFANNAWLQELPKPLTKLTWDNVALISPATAERLNLTNEDLVELHYDGRTVQAPVWIMPGQANETVTVHLGYGRTRAGHVGTNVGFNAYAIRTSNALWFSAGPQIIKTGDQYDLASTQHHHSLEGRNVVRVGTIEEYRRNPNFAKEMGEDPPRDLTLYPNYQYEGYAWGMAIDLNACTGCNACVVACQAENNIPVVGKREVGIGREMHWLRIDRYFQGNLDNPEVY
ncbi:MAG: TAT-variant-translocated molybdopterin oxidoreductase [Acidobacteria bacterium]|nr:TAT-variant-translocated molybdopterin oxidoreductase [Acidobacteriota bacterium]